MTNFLNELKNPIYGPFHTFHIPFVKFFLSQFQEKCWKDNGMDPGSKDPYNNEQAGQQIRTGER